MGVTYSWLFFRISWCYPWSFLSPGPSQNVPPLIFLLYWLHGLGFLWLWLEEQAEMARMPALRPDLRNLVIVMQLLVILSGTKWEFMEGWKEGMMVWCSCHLRCMAWGGMRLLTVCGEASPLKLNLWSLNYRYVLTSLYFILCISQIFHL